MEENIYRIDGDVILMNFWQISWADSDLESINISYDRTALNIWNDDLQKKIIIECTGLAGITDICIWDDTIINTACLQTVDVSNSSFLEKLREIYDEDWDYGGRSLKDVFYELKIELVNNTSFSIYCQNVSISVIE